MPMGKKRDSQCSFQPFWKYLAPSAFTLWTYCGICTLPFQATPQANGLGFFIVQQSQALRNIALTENFTLRQMKTCSTRSYLQRRPKHENHKQMGFRQYFSFYVGVVIRLTPHVSSWFLSSFKHLFHCFPQPCFPLLILPENFNIRYYYLVQGSKGRVTFFGKSLLGTLIPQGSG